MESHSETTSLLDKTIANLSNGSVSVSAMEGTSLIDQWIQSLRQGENTRVTAMADQLEQLRQALDNPTPQSENIHDILEKLATSVAEFSADTGSEGEITTQLQSLATALRNVSGQISTAE
ncbi:hypothetical protein [Tellurirhabdus rosea]|uniref:hypothetical protein n=1 Tax=Tellurirhabdus rosea TaxID=2674997 RepID=UPI00225A2395|nr:hypothetical protein [Tellurirhabdus rosea]